MNLARRVLCGWLAVAVLPHSASAQLSSNQKVKCANAYEQAQRTRNEGLFRAAREHTLVCADEVCPSVLRTECVKWLGEIDAAMPTVLVVARDGSGNEVSDVNVVVDGTKVLERLDGKALPVDPGIHTFRFTRAGSATVEQKILIREAEKRRPVLVTFGGGATLEPSKPAASDTPSSVPVATWILGGVGLVALGLSLPIYLNASKRKSELDDDPCAFAQTCAPSRVEGVRRQYIYGDVALGVGIVALAGATIVWLATPKRTVTAAVAPLPGGVAAGLRFTF